jgi:pyruvate ferredoxin oxidoreductase alpha subunit
MSAETVREGAGWRDIPRGGFIVTPGNAAEYKTGDWRTSRPVWHPERCVHCLVCWVFCPDASIIVSEGKVTGIDYAHCKGCGICAAECPGKAGAIEMIRETEMSREPNQTEGAAPAGAPTPAGRSAPTSTITVAREITPLGGVRPPGQLPAHPDHDRGRSSNAPATASSPASRRVALTGNEAVALAMRQINPDVVAAYPITPQTDIVQYFASFVAEGLVDTEFMTAESEHSAMSATVGAAASGARAMTATSANGLALMWEVLYIAAGNRLPIVMPVVNRALPAPINIHCDHSDAMGARDSGWVQLWSEDAQEAYDNVLQAVRIAEDDRVRLPVMVCYDGFIISHALLNLNVLPDEVVRDFIGRGSLTDPATPAPGLLDPEHPITVGPLDLYDFYFEHKRQQAEAMFAATVAIRDAAEDYARLSGRLYRDFEAHQLDDAETAIVILGSAAGTAKYTIDHLRREGRKVGLLKLRVFRPFPGAALAHALSGKRAIAVMDRSDSFSAGGGPLFAEVRAALYGLLSSAPVATLTPSSSAPTPSSSALTPSSSAAPTQAPTGRLLPLVVNVIYGLGGRDLDPGQIRSVFDHLDQLSPVAHSARAGEAAPAVPSGLSHLASKEASHESLISYLGVRE